MAHASGRLQHAGVGDIDLVVDERLDYMPPEGRCAGKRLSLLTIAPAGGPYGSGHFLRVHAWGIDDLVTPIDKQSRRVLLVKQLFLIVADNDQDVRRDLGQ